MGSNEAQNSMISGKDEATCSETTVEIKIKTLDSQTYTLRVDKCVPVPALKEHIASVTGVLSEQQRLICRGKVLKDDQLLSAYHVEDGHTLHLVVRQPIAPSSEGSPDAATDPASSGGRSHRSPGVLIGSFNISEQDGGFPDLSRVISAVLGSIGLTSIGGGSEVLDLNEPPTEGLTTLPGFSSVRISSRQVRRADSRIQSAPDSGTSSHPTTVDPAESLPPPVIPDSLATLSQNLSRLRQEFLSIAEEQSNTGHSAGGHERNGQNLDEISTSSVQRGLPTPASLADVMQTTRQLLVEQAAECLQQLARQLEAQTNVTDTLERTRIHSNALRSGILFQNLGAVLLELSRTTMTLRMGETPADAVVNSGPAVFLSSNGPNPIMVQPLPFQPGTGLGALSGGSVQQSPGLSGGSRNIDIRIRTVGSFNPSTVNRRESTGAQNPGQTAPTASGNGNSVQQQAAAGGSGSSAIRESEIRVVPIRTVIAAVPASGSRAATTSDPSSSPMGIMHPVITRVQHVTSGNLGVARASSQSPSNQNIANPVDLGSQSIPESIAQQDTIGGVPGVVDSSDSSFVDGQGLPAQIHSRINQWLRSMFPGENVHIIGPDGQELDPIPVAAAQNADNSQAAAASDEGMFLSNLLRQIMPIISENTDSNTSTSNTHGVDQFDNESRGTSSREREDEAAPSSSSQASPKRQKRE